MELIVFFLYVIIATVAGVIAFRVTQLMWPNEYSQNMAAWWVASLTTLFLPVAIPVWIGLGVGIWVLTKLGAFKEGEDGQGTGCAD